jgi:hypothetical protein
VRRIPFLVAVLVLVAVPARPDQVEDELRSALEKWKSGDHPGAHDHVRMADAKMSELEAQGVAKAWGRVPGYTMELQDPVSMGQVLGGTISSGVTYTATADSTTMDGSIVANSPILGMMSGLISNAFMASASGATIERVAGHKVALQKEGDRWQGNMPYKNTVLISVEGNVKEDVLKVYEAFHYGVIDSTLVME